MGDASEGSSELLRLVLEAAREMSRQEDPGEVLKVASVHGRRVLKFDRSIAVTRRELPRPVIRITRADAPGTDFHDPTGHDEFEPVNGGIMSELLYAGQAKLVDDLVVEPRDPGARYLAGMRSLAAIPQYRGGEALDMVFHLRREPAAYAPQRFAELALISSLLGQSIANLARARELELAEKSIKEQYDIIANLSTTVMNSAMDLKQANELLEMRVRH